MVYLEIFRFRKQNSANSEIVKLRACKNIFSLNSKFYILCAYNYIFFGCFEYLNSFHIQSYTNI